MSTELSNEIKENNKKIIKEAMEKMIKDGIISPRIIKINITEEIKKINQDLNNICKGVKCETSYNAWMPPVNLFEIGLIQKLDGKKLEVGYLEKFKSDISRVGSMITTNREMPLAQLYKEEFQDINYRLVTIIECIRDHKIYSLTESMMENTKKIEKLDDTVKSNKNKIKEFQELLNFYIWQRYEDKIVNKKKKIIEKIIFGILLATSVIGVSLGIKSCLDNYKQNEAIKEIRSKFEWDKDENDEEKLEIEMIAKFIKKQKTR